MTMSASHADMVGPPAAPRVTIPDLWKRVRSFLAAMFETHGAPRQQLYTPLNGNQRSAILRWLKPAERMARQLILAAALTHLLMTEHGRRLRATAKPLPPPSSTPPSPPARRDLNIVHTGINLGATIASYQASKALQRMAERAEVASNTTAATEPSGAAGNPVDPNDPSTWRAPFRILRWLEGGPGAPPVRAIAAKPSPPDPRRLIRRLEALRRALDDPAPRIKRLAAWLARLPKNLLGLPPPQLRHRGRPNPILRDDLFAIDELLEPAVAAFNTS